MTEHQPQITPASSPAEPKVKSVRKNALHTFVLNRPRVLNAFDDEMCRLLAAEIPRIARNPDVYIVALASESPKAFCAGGDILALTDEAKRDMEEAKAYLRNEYRLNWLLECFSKPVVSFIDGLCMGSGAGLTCYNTHRVAGEGYKWAMPETKIGFFPDVGVANILSRMPWPLGLYLGLTGAVVTRADAQWLGLATHCLPSAKFQDIRAKLAEAQPVDPLLDGLNEMQGEGPLQSAFRQIEEFFSISSVGAICDALAKAKGVNTDWAQKTLVDLRQRSPTALAITDRHIRSARALDRRETLIQDYRLAVRFLDSEDLYAGVTAALRDKKPVAAWSPGRIEGVESEMIDTFFAPIGDGELDLPGRAEMQEARV